MIVDIQTILLWAILIGGIVYETTMWIYRRVTAGEQFTLEKYALTYGYVGLFAVVTYYVTGAIPGVQDIMVNLTSVPDVAAFLPLITALFMGIFQQGSKKLQSSGITAPSVVPSVPATPPVMGKVLGIYGGSVKSNPPQQSFTCDVNQIPMTFFDIAVEVTGKFMYQVFMDGKPLTEPMGTNWKTIGAIMTYDFYINHNFRVPGAHSVDIVIGTQPQQDGKTVWNGKYTYPVVFTGVVPLE